MDVLRQLLPLRTLSQKKSGFDELYEIVYSDKKETLPDFPLQTWDTKVSSACTGPNAGVTSLTLDSEELVNENGDDVNGVAGGIIEKWNTPNESCFGSSVSLYESKVNKKSGEDKLLQIKEALSTSSSDAVRHAGDPIADVYGSIVRGNNTALALADGSGWGKKPRLAARCAVRAALDHIVKCTEIFNGNPSSTTVFRILKSAIRNSQKLILKKNATLTTLSIAIVCNRTNGNQAVFSASVGDCSIFIYSPKNGTIMETTIGSHPNDGSRSHRSSGGSLGPFMGCEPDLANLSFSCISVVPGDIVMLMSDGVSDNFLAKTLSQYGNESGALTIPSKAGHAVPHFSVHDKNHVKIHDCCAVSHSLLESLQSHHDNLQDHMTAQTCTNFILNTVAEISEDKRRFHEACIKDGIDERMKEKEDPVFAKEKKSKIGKLDHATVLCYQIE